ncbi:MAG: 2-succinyl-5-enolpyruvyl-6-hydroxy-3-cyclohexene-1-carboxylic-acid synthase [bacterium]
MYSDIKNVQILISLLKEYNIKHLVLSPGNRNVPFVHSVENDPFFECYSIVDERSAAFFALGLIQELRKPVAVSCTSGTSICNYTSAVSEAYYQKIPLVVIAADRNPYYLNQQENQMIPQKEILGSICKKSVQLPMIKNEKDFRYCQRLVNEALLEINHNGYGPVHINIPIEEEILSFSTKTLPNTRLIKRLVRSDSDILWMNKVEELKRSNRILIIYGQSITLNSKERDIIEKFTEKYNCIIAVDHLSNLRCKGSVETFNISRIISQDAFENLLPEIVITMNGNYVSYVRGLLKGYKGRFKHWIVSEDGLVADSLESLTDIIECSSSYFFEFFTENAGKNIKENIYYNEWAEMANNIEIPEFPYSDIYAVQKLMEKIPSNSLLHLANSSSVRLAQHFSLDGSITVYCNRGTNGIDGSMSSFIGQASVSNRLSFLLIGDLSFFYDMNAIWNRYAGNNIRILLNNNAGAGIFHFNIGINKVSTLDKHTAVEHTAVAKGWVESMGFKYISARNKKEFDQNLPIFMDDTSDKPIIFEVFTNKEEDANILHNFYDINRSVKDKAIKVAKRAIKSILNK